MPMTPQELKTTVSSGLLSFPLTDFDSDGEFRPDAYAQRLEWLAPYGAKALFAAGGAGEFFSLTGDEYPRIIRAAVASCRDKVPIIAGAGGPTRFAIACAQEAERAGAQGILLLPHYMTEAGQQGLAAHVQAVCDSTSLGVIVYNRGISRLQPDALARLAGRCPNLVGFKDGIGDIELMVSIRQKLGDRLAYLCGLPTAEVYAAAYKGLGISVYSSAVFNFVPKTAVEFHDAVASDDQATQQRLLREFFLPFIELRNRGAGYAVSLIKTGARLVGHDAGPVRTPLTEPTAPECEKLGELIRALGSQ
jgi:5-dehydro-4-deoxyglucarate dehydratase